MFWTSRPRMRRCSLRNGGLFLSVGSTPLLTTEEAAEQTITHGSDQHSVEGTTKAEVADDRIAAVWMPQNSITSMPPPACPSCGSISAVKQETTIKGASTTLLWHCIRCDYRWPIKGSNAA